MIWKIASALFLILAFGVFTGIALFSAADWITRLMCSGLATMCVGIALKPDPVN